MTKEFLECSLEKPSHKEYPPNAESFYPPDFFRPPTLVEKTNNTVFLPNELVLPKAGADVPRLAAKEKYADLRVWNREKYGHMVDILETPFLDVAERIMNFVLTQPQEIRRRANSIQSFQVPYRFAGLPPNLYDHLDSSQPFLPSTRQEVTELVGEFQVYNKRLRELRHWDKVQIGKEQFYRDLAIELIRRQREDIKLFSTEQEREAWQEYSRLFRSHCHKKGMRPTFLQNVEFVNYLNNRRFSEENGFFEKTDGMFDGFMLTDLYRSRSAFTAQIRVPFNDDGHFAADELLRSTHVLMELVMEDERLNEDLYAIRIRHGDFLQSHLTRARELEHGSVENGSRRALLEGIASISALFACCEADGIPGFESDLWAGFEALLQDDVPVKITAKAALAIIVPSTLHGNYFKHLLEATKQGFRVRPTVAIKIQEIHDRQTTAIHQAWQTYYQKVEERKRSPSLPAPEPPIRFGLHCPFKSNVVRQFSEALILCRAAIHDMTIQRT